MQTPGTKTSQAPLSIWDWSSRWHGKLRINNSTIKTFLSIVVEELSFKKKWVWVCFPESNNVKLDVWRIINCQLSSLVVEAGCCGTCYRPNQFNISAGDAQGSSNPSARREEEASRGAEVTELTAPSSGTSHEALCGQAALLPPADSFSFRKSLRPLAVSRLTSERQVSTLLPVTSLYIHKYLTS